ncbi:hypothetical protein QTP70_031527 [Hemibagrus guttatus]|uniref:Sleeping Beauty transposase HTH domain-containing protein n=1 Tax=Hemibagrus guttatus TaxID=175788 RepID=A0AAE0VDX8_9TELE|nr:hypothetical protein QTP70_031527 [Hemibagrus guttatus]
MPRSKEIQKQMRKKVIEIYQSGKGYKAISKALGLPRTTVRAIIYKWRKHGTVENLPRSGQPNLPKLPQERSDNSSRRSQKTPQQHPKNCRPHLSQLRWKCLICSDQAANDTTGNISYISPDSKREIARSPDSQVFVEFTRVVSKDLERDFFGDIKYSLTAAQTKTSKIMS